ncbi:WecB/TagA/CpsF family glycosyltransferase [Proteocatella sphenisci]|uniref:WecB/TagA/CpsF family glycosyltransferase n=1 Tax=Proteocatella sphenisci TaxID=181070 RepID=UPI00048BCFF6|nr:WecB/TagA/CpsF family glycosyltransferase [Proteocatella sphenisci]
MRILGVRIDHVDMKGALKKATENIDPLKPFVIVTPNSEIVVKANQEKELLKFIENAGMVVPDGIGLVIGSKLVKQPLKERVTGIDLMVELVKYASLNKKSVYFLGGKPGFADQAADKLKEQFPGLEVAGTHHGYFKGIHTGAKGHSEEVSVIEDIKSKKPDMVFVAFGAPKQEYFIDAYKDVLGAGLLMGVGGSLDVISGNVKRAPQIYQKMGMEWAYRLAKEPWRIKRAGALPIFALNVLIKKDRPM